MDSWDHVQHLLNSFPANSNCFSLLISSSDPLDLNINIGNQVMFVDLAVPKVKQVYFTWSTRPVPPRRPESLRCRSLSRRNRHCQMAQMSSASQQAARHSESATPASHRK